MGNAEVSVNSGRLRVTDQGRIDATPFAKSYGIKLPVMLTEKVWKEVVQTDEVSRMYGQKEEKRFSSLLEKLKMELMKGKSRNCSFVFMLCKDQKTTSCRVLKVNYSEDGNGKPFIVVSLDSEKLS
jgi:hypothetical protein